MYCFLNGEMVDKDIKNLRIENRGFTFSDGLFEVIRILEGKTLFLPDHFKRMQESAKFFNLNLAFSEEDCLNQVNTLIRENDLDDGEVYIELSRGDDEFREHSFSERHEGTFTVLTLPLRHINPDNWKNGVILTLYPDLRHQLCEHKTVNLLTNCMAKNFAYSNGAYDSMMFRSSDGSSSAFKKAKFHNDFKVDEFNGENYDNKYITEGGSSTYFLVKDGVVLTPEIDNILPGITRKKVIKLCMENGIPIVERRVFLEELKDADEVFLASTVSKVMPVREVRGKGYEVPGTVTKKLMEKFEELIREELSEVK